MKDNDIIKEMADAMTYEPIGGDESIVAQPLSVAYKSQDVTYAVCETCERVYIDDLPYYGTVKCPNCQAALRRGFAAPEAKRFAYRGKS